MPKNTTKKLENLPKTGKSRWNDLAPFCPVSREKFRQLCLAGKAPTPIRISNRITVYDNVEFHSWLEDPIGYQAKPIAKSEVKKKQEAKKVLGGVEHV